MVRIITDSASDIDAKYASENDIVVLPVHVLMDGKEYLDRIDITSEEFFEKLPNLKELPKTSQVPPFEFEQIFEKYKDDDVIVITMSKGISGTYQSPMIAKDEFDNIDVVDSTNISCGEKALVKYAVRLVKEGKTKLEILKLLDEKKNKLHLVGLMDTLEYLKKGGRISAAVAAIGSILNIKPVVEIIEGKVKMGTKARGLKNGNSKVKEKIEEYGIDYSMPICMAYSGTNDDPIKLHLDLCGELYQNVEKDISLIGPSIGTHIGPNSIAIAFFSK